MEKLNRVMRDRVKCDFVFMFRLPHKKDLEIRNWRQVIYLGIDLNEYGERVGK